MDLRMKVLKCAFRLHLNRVTVSDSHVSFPWMQLLLKVVIGLPGYFRERVMGNEE